MVDGILARQHAVLVILGVLLPFTFFLFWTKGYEDRIFNANFNALKVRRDLMIEDTLPSPIAALNVHFIIINSNEVNTLINENSISLVFHDLYSNIMKAFEDSDLPIIFDERIIQDSEWTKKFISRDNQLYINEDVLIDNLYEMFEDTRRYQAIISNCIECTDLYLYLYNSSEQVHIENTSSTTYSNGFINHQYNSAVLFLPPTIKQENIGEITRVAGNQFRALLHLMEQSNHVHHPLIVSKEEVGLLEQAWIDSMFAYCVQTCISYEQVFPMKTKEFVMKWNHIISILNSFQGNSTSSYSTIRSAYVYLLELQHTKVSTPPQLPWDQELAVLAPFWIPIFVPIIKGLYSLFYSVNK
jgi:hypothetical protein